MVGFYQGRADRLILYVRQLAWLYTAPEKHKSIKDKSEPESRLKQMRAEGREIPLPLNPAPHLSDWLFEIGPTSGEEPLTWREMQSWQEITGIELDPWEAKTLRQASIAYAGQKFDSRKVDCPAPYTDEVIANREAVASKVASIFGGRGLKK